MTTRKRKPRKMKRRQIKLDALTRLGTDVAQCKVRMIQVGTHGGKPLMCAKVGRIQSPWTTDKKIAQGYVQFAFGIIVEMTTDFEGYCRRD